jgi:transposase
MEPGCKAPYSIDLRWRVVWLRISSFLEISQRLGIATSTSHRIFAEFLSRGGVEPKGNKGPRRFLRKLNAYEEMFIVGLVLETPSLYLKELCTKIEEFSGIVVCEATICNILHRHGLTTTSCPSTLCTLKGGIHGQSPYVQKRTVCMAR